MAQSVFCAGQSEARASLLPLLQLLQDTGTQLNTVELKLILLLCHFLAPFHPGTKDEATLKNNA